MCQGRPADPTDPGDAADLSIMGYQPDRVAIIPRRRRAVFLLGTFSHERLKINSFLTNPRESLGLT